MKPKSAFAPEDDVVMIDLTAPTGTPAAEPPVVLGDDADIAVINTDGADKKLPKRAIEHDDGSIELPLYQPVVLRWKGTDSGIVNTDPPVESVTFRRLTGKDVRVVLSAGSDGAFFNELTHASVRGQFPLKHKWLNIFDRMDGADCADCIKIAQHFLENGPRTPGPKS